MRKIEKKICVIFIFLSLFGGEFGSDHPSLKILPRGDQEVRQGKNIVLTCRAHVPSLELVKDLRWYDSQERQIKQDDRVYTEEQPGEAGIALFIKQISDHDEGIYTCKAVYASNQRLDVSVKISLYVGITWVDAPTTQYAREGHNYKIRCKVRASPPANIDWLKESLIISTGNQYIIESDGLVIHRVSKENAGTYTCRARVPETGELEERDIQLDVQEPPVWVQRPFDLKGIEKGKVELQCTALGSPSPKYTWVDKDGIDATEKEGWKLHEITGTLTAYQVRRQDAGKYTCIVENNAGRLEASADLAVIIRPKVQELYNRTFEVGRMNAELKCRASGDPLPRLQWRKWSSNEPLLMGGQPNDPRIVIRESVIAAPDYTEGEKNWMELSLVIDGILRQDDGLYECKAENDGGSFYKSGHITVEFPPSFEDQPMDKEWSWDQRPVNLTCIARSIPNATISWWFNDQEIGRDALDRNFQIKGHGPRSDLIVTPLETVYYRKYQCKAENPHGLAFHDIILEEAHEPSVLQQAILDKSTATTLQFRFVQPTDIGGLPLDSYAVEYKYPNEDWRSARRRVWPIDIDGNGYILENLTPKTTYDLRFGCKNRVGFSPWGVGIQLTTPMKGRPEAPILSIQTGPGEVLIGDVIELPRSKEYEVSWQIPEDNGVAIDFFLLTYFPVHKDREGTGWKRIGDIKKVEIPHRGNVRWGLQLDYQDTFYQVGLSAHNLLGYSLESALIIKTPKDLVSPPLPPKPTFHTSSPTSKASKANTFLVSFLSIIVNLKIYF